MFGATAQNILDTALAEIRKRADFISALESELLAAAGVRLGDIIDLVGGPFDIEGVTNAGWRREEFGIWRCESACLPNLSLQEKWALALRVDRMEMFVDAHGASEPIDGEAGSPLRRLRVHNGLDLEVVVLERNGWRGLHAPPINRRKLRRARLHQQIFRTRRRHFRNVESGLNYLDRLIEIAAADLGPDWACSLFLRAEREYWAANCSIGALQQRRQERAGFGWANIDHYAYCASREFALATTRILRRIGFQPIGSLSEHRHSGGLVLEQPALRCFLVLEFDVETSDRELSDPSALASLTWRYDAGLWSAMHGESILDGGPRYIGARCDLAALRRQLHAEGVTIRANSTSGPIEWFAADCPPRAVRPARVDELERLGYLSPELAEQYRLEGAFAAHFQGVARAGGYKGFAPPAFYHANTEQPAVAPLRSSRRRRAEVEP